MKQILICGTLVLLAGSLLAADSDDVKSAAQKLADKGSYSWKTTVTVPEGGGGRFRPGPTEGKTEKDGYTWLSMTRGDNTIEAVLKGGKGAAKMQEGWQSLAELSADDQPGPGMFMARMLSNFKAPAADAADLVARAKEIKKDGDAYLGDLTEDGAKGLLTFGGRRGGGPAPTVSNAKGSVKFWLKDGVLAKYGIKVQGSVSFNENNMDVDRTTTVEIKDIGATKVEVPEDAKKKLQ